MRSTILDVARGDEMARLKELVANADVFFANRRPGYVEAIGLSTDDLTLLRPGIVHVDISIYGSRGPWANRIGFDQTAVGVSGLQALVGAIPNTHPPANFFVDNHIPPPL